MKKIKLIIIALLMGVLTRAQIVPVQVLDISPEVLCSGDSTLVRFTIPSPPPPNLQFQVLLILKSGSFILFDTVFTGYTSSLVSTDTMPSGARIYKIKKHIPFGTPAGQWSVSGNILNQNPYIFTINNCGGSFNPCDTIFPGISYSTLCHTFCISGTYELNGPNCGWERIRGQYCDTNSFAFKIDNGPLTLTPSIIFTPSVVGVTNFTLTGTRYINNEPCFQSISWSFTTVACTYTYTDVGVNEYSLNAIQPIYFNMQGIQVAPCSNQLLIEQVGNRRRKIIIQDR